MQFFKKSGWNEQIIFEYAKRHLSAAEILFQNQDDKIYLLSVFSAGYLCHLGIELLLKGCWLYESGYFEDEHDLHKIIKKISFLNLNTNLSVSLANIQLLDNMRYPQDLS